MHLTGQVVSGPMDGDLLHLDATGQAELVRAGELAPHELVAAAIEKIEALDPTLNAVIHRRFEAALAEASADSLPAGPFQGVPFLVKDLYEDSSGDPAYEGSRVLRDAAYVARSDSWLVARYGRAGFVRVGRTNTPELGLVGITEPESYGPTHNPWDTSRSPGGSSGGSAAAVAAGMVAIATGGDGAGSIRIPASMCGLVGLKPSRGRMTPGPDGDGSGVGVKNVLARSVRDVAAVLDAVSGPGPGDLVVAPPPRRVYAAEVTERPRSLRIGALAHTPNGVLHPDCEAAVRRTASLLEGLGHHVEFDHPAALDDPDVLNRFLVRWSISALLGVIRLGAKVGRELTADDVEPVTWALAEAGRRTTAGEYAMCVAAGARFARAMAPWWETVDLLLTPTLAEPPPRIGEKGPSADDPAGLQAGLVSLARFTFPFNITGQPAITLPLSWNDAGLPIGTQLAAAYGREDLLVQVAAQLEEAQPWADHRPPVA